MRRVLLGALLAAGVFASPAAAQIPPPSIVTDTHFAFQGVNEYDAGVSTSDSGARAAYDAGLDRSYAVGSSDGKAVIVARRGDGSLDSGFDGDGALALNDLVSGSDVVVLANHRLRVLGSVDADPGAPVDLDPVVVGLMPDGSLDGDFGTDGVETFPVTTGDEVASALAVDPATGRLAVAGQTGGQDPFLAVRKSDGSEDQPVAVLPGGTSTSAGDVAWNAGSPVVAVNGTTTTVLHEFKTGGFQTAVTVPGADAVQASGLLAYGGALWVAGRAVLPGGGSDAFLARVNGNGGALETRRFDFRGSLFPAPQPVDSAAGDLAIAPGDPDTLVIGGSADAGGGDKWAFAAFNGLGGALSALQTVDLVIPISGTGAPSGVAAGPGGTATAAGTVTDANGDASIGMARVLIDAEKRCDLSLTIVSPVELTLRGLTPGSVTVRIANSGSRPCAGTVKSPAPWSVVSGDVNTGRMLPGDAISRTFSLAHAQPFPADATLSLSLDAPAEAALGDNVSSVRAEFAFCDLQLSVLNAPVVLGTEGARGFSFSLRNVGTAPCKASQVLAGGQGRLLAVPSPFAVAAGHSVEDAFDVGVLKGTKSGRSAALGFRAIDADDVNLANNALGANAMVVRPGDTTARKPVNGRLFTGRAKAGSAAGVSKRTLRVRRVQISVQKTGKRCEFLSSRTGDLRRVDEGPRGKCDALVWVTVKGTSKWRLRLKERLPKGAYTLRSRAVLANGVPEGRFTKGDKNLVRFRVR
jgi:hypothetical protein